MVRELLAGQKESGRGSWPPAVSAALDSPAFAAELRDMMLRTAERGITPGRLAELGRRRHRPEWRAAALFAREYQDVSDLRQGSSGLGAALDQAELTRAALGLLADDTLLAAEQSRVRRVFVDEYQDVDPAQARLIELLASGAEELVVFGDPDQSIYAFRGSDPGSAAGHRGRLDRVVDVVPAAGPGVADRIPAGCRHAARCVAAPRAHARPPAADAAGERTARDPSDGRGCGFGGGQDAADGSRAKPHSSPTSCAERISVTACRGREWRSWCARRRHRCRRCAGRSRRPESRSSFRARIRR